MNAEELKVATQTVTPAKSQPSCTGDACTPEVRNGRSAAGATRRSAQGDTAPG